jgi:hypothetical protein
MATQDSRIKIKRSTITGTVPTVPSSNDHTDGTWIATDIYKGELFYNQSDGVLWTRGDSGIECIQGTAKLTIATADVLTLNSTPLTIVAAQGVGTVIQVISASVKIDFNTTPYATNIQLQIISSGSVKAQHSQNVLDASVSTVRFLAEQAATVATDTQLLENADLQVAVRTGNPTAGDSDITIYVTYRIITL